MTSDAHQRRGDVSPNAPWIVVVVLVTLGLTTIGISRLRTTDSRFGGESPTWLDRHPAAVLPEDFEILRREFPGYVLPLERVALADRLAASIDADDEAEALRLLERGADADWSGMHYARRSETRAPLFRAIKRGNPRIVEAILQRGARAGGPAPDDIIYCRNQFRQTPLYFAVRCGNREVVDLLLKYEAPISGSNGYGKTPIVGAVENGDLDMFQHLLDAGAKCDFSQTFAADRLSDPDVIHRPAVDYFVRPFPDDCGSRCSLMELADRSVSARLREVVNAEFEKVAEKRPHLRAEVAVYLDDVAELRRLIAAGYDPATYEPEQVYDDTLFALATRSRSLQCLDLLTQATVGQAHESQPSEQNPGTGNVLQYEESSPLRLLVTAGNVAELKRRLDQGAEFGPVPHSQPSPLTRAVMAKREAMVSFLLRRPEAGDSWLADPLLMPTALPYASHNQRDRRSREICLMLLKAGATIRSIPVQQIQPHDNPLVRAAAAGWRDVYEFIAAREPELINHSQALQAAAFGNQTAMCRYLLSRGADPDSLELPHRRSLLHYALFHRNAELMRVLISAGANRNYPPQFDVSKGYNSFEDYGHPLYHAALVGDTAFCRFLLSEFPGEAPWQALQYVPYEYDNDVHYFIRGNTPLFAAVYGDHVETLRLLLAHASKRDQTGRPQLDVNARNAYGATALHEAVLYGSSKCVQLLLANGADVTIPRLADKQGRGATPLHLANYAPTAPHMYARPQHALAIDAVFPLLFAASIRVNEPGWLDRASASGVTPLHVHAKAGNRAVCRKLLELGADPNAPDDYGASPLVSAIVGNNSRYFTPESHRQARSRLCLDLVEAGATFDGQASPYKLSYHALADRFGLFEFCAELEQRGATADIQQHPGEYVCSAVRFRRMDLLEQRVAAGVDVNATTFYRERALHMAVAQHDIAACRLLLAHGADPNLRNEDDQTALFCVFQHFHNKMKRFVRGNPRNAEEDALQLVLSQNR